jgi:hypothetical protein
MNMKTFVSGVHLSTEGGPAVSTASSGNKGRQQKPKPKAAVSGDHDALVDEVTLQLQSSKDFAKAQGHTRDSRANPRGAAALASTYEGFHDNCQDAAAGRRIQA